MSKWYFLLFVIAYSASAHASGGNVLGLMWAELSLFILVVVSLFFVKIKLKNKMIIFGFYFVAMACALWITGGIPYSNNLILINTINIALPAVAWAVGLAYCLKNKVRNETKT